MDLTLLRAALERDEGYRSKPYRCSAGYLTIGVGWNLDERGLPATMIDELLSRAISESVTECKRMFTGWDSLNQTRQHVLINMMFNLGFSRLSGFKRFIAAVEARDYMKAADEMLDSKWARQVGSRAERLSVEMRLGSI
ncbi:MAG: glycoside hydrolase family protein [Pontibacterium sp.]